MGWVSSNNNLAIQITSVALVEILLCDTAVVVILFLEF